MEYFDDLKFITGGAVTDSCVQVVNKMYPGYYGIQFIVEGEIFVHAEGKKAWQANGPLVFFTSPDRKFTHYTPNGTRTHMFICFSGPRVQRYIEGGLFPQETGIKIPVAHPRKLISIFSKLLFLLRKIDSISHGELVLGLEKLLLQISQQTHIKQKNESYGNLMEEIGEKIVANPGKEWDFAEIAKEYHLSESHFRRLFTDEMGIAPWKYVLNCRIHYACQLLDSTALLIKEIALECGFSSAFNFSRQFHKIMKVSPEEYRKRI